MVKDESTEDTGLQAAFDKATEGMELKDADFQAAADAPTEEAADTPEPEAEEKAEAKPEPKAKPVAKAAKEVSRKSPEIAGKSADDISAPANWDAKRKEAFGKLPSEAKTLVLDMAKSVEADAAKQKPFVDYGRAVASLVTDQHRQQMAAGGMKNEIEGIARLIELNDRATRDFGGYLHDIIGQVARDNRVSPEQVVLAHFPQLRTGTAQPGQGQQPQPQPVADPRLNQVYDTTRQVASRLEAVENAFRSNQLRSADTVISRFRDEQDDAGNLRHPHFAAVEERMTALLKTPDFLGIEDMGERLMRAYEAAVALDPNIRQQFLDGEVARQLEAKRKADDLARARKAKAPINAAPSGPARSTPRGLDAAIGQAMSLVGG